MVRTSEGKVGDERSRTPRGRSSEIFEEVVLSGKTPFSHTLTDRGKERGISQLEALIEIRTAHGLKSQLVHLVPSPLNRHPSTPAWSGTL